MDIIICCRINTILDTIARGDFCVWSGNCGNDRGLIMEEPGVVENFWFVEKCRRSLACDSDFLLACFECAGGPSGSFAD